MRSVSIFSLWFCRAARKDAPYYVSTERLVQPSSARVTATMAAEAVWQLSPTHSQLLAGSTERRGRPADVCSLLSSGDGPPVAAPSWATGQPFSSFFLLSLLFALALPTVVVVLTPLLRVVTCPV